MDGTPLPAPDLWLGLVQQVSQCGRQLRRALAELAAPRNLTDTDALILWACHQAGPVGHPQHELATVIGVSPAQLSGLLEGLGERGWLVGRRPPQDRRRQHWRTTPSGEALLAALLQDLALWSSQLATVLPAAQRTTLQAQLTQLSSATVQLTVVPVKEAA